MRKKIFATVASTTAAIAAVGLIAAGPASATTPIGTPRNSCVGAPGGAQHPEPRPDGIWIADPLAVLSSVQVSSIGTGSLDGAMPGKLTGGGILVPTHGIGIGTLSGTYHRADLTQCTVDGLFMLS